jgi:hypothetical protein
VSEFVLQYIEHRTKEVRVEALKNLKMICNVVGIEKMGLWVIKLKKEIALSNEMRKDCEKLYDYYKAYFKI